MSSLVLYYRQRDNVMSMEDNKKATTIARLVETDNKDIRGYPILENERACIACCFCAVECPVDAIEMVVPEK